MVVALPTKPRSLDYACPLASEWSGSARDDQLRSCVLLRGHLSGLEIVLGWDSERVGNAVKEGDHGSDIDRFGNLILGPAEIAQPLHVFVG